METNSQISVVDRRADRRGAPFYRLSARCSNCSHFHVALISKGDALKYDKARVHDLRCPHCECAGYLMHGNALEAETFLADKEAVNVEQIGTGFVPVFTGVGAPND